MAKTAADDIADLKEKIAKITSFDPSTLEIDWTALLCQASLGHVVRICIPETLLLAQNDTFLHTDEEGVVRCTVGEM